MHNNGDDLQLELRPSLYKMSRDTLHGACMLTWRRIVVKGAANALRSRIVVRPAPSVNTISPLSLQQLSSRASIGILQLEGQLPTACRHKSRQ